MKHNQEDKPKYNDSGHPDEKGFSIIVNGREKTVDHEELTFDQVVSLAFEEPPTGKALYFTITYRRGGGRKSEGILVKGEVVKVRDGTVINVTVTDKS